MKQPSTAAPEISIVVPTHGRPLRLRWLLNALEEQTLPSERFEVVVGYDGSAPETERLLREHPLAAAGALRSAHVTDGSAPGKNRNAALRLARAPIVAFTDDDCRPPPDWLEGALAAARRHPGAIVQGCTEPDPDEEHLLNAPHARTQRVDPPGPYAQACNIVYPRELLERLGGFDETMLTGEDADLACRGREAGAPYLGAPEVLTWHAVSTPTLVGRLRSTWRWRFLPLLVKRHPEHRGAYPLRIFWKHTHVGIPLALTGLALGRRRRAYALLAIPWLYRTAPQEFGTSPRGRLRALFELPARALIALTEFGVLVWGSIKHRTLFL
jgi:GT2 family glycosyltransferase